MHDSKTVKVALVGNPNSGKSSLFNCLTGLNQKTGNFPGVTVEKRIGHSKMPNKSTAQILDLPGIYSLYPRSLDEQIVTEILLHHRSPDCPDVVVLTVDATNLRRSLLLVTQVIDLGLPTVLALNMMDLLVKEGVSFNLKELASELGIPVVPVNSRTGAGVDHLKRIILEHQSIPQKAIFPLFDESKSGVKELRDQLGVDNDYEAYQYLQQPNSLNFLNTNEREVIERIKEKHKFFPGKFHGAETVQRYGFIQQLMEKIVLESIDEKKESSSTAIDRILTHRVWGYAIFFGILFIIFQSIFAWATVPMDLIDGWFADLSNYLEKILPDGPLTRMLTEGVVPGIGGIVIFIPQIAILFAFISILEESGYMARVVFLMDKLMRKFGMSGKSVVPLMSGVACAIPAIMATRTIDNWKERLITILVTPLMSCSARLPVFTILIALIVPEQMILGFFNLQGLVLMALYLLGLSAALLSAYVIKWLIHLNAPSYLIMELPTYRWPKWSNVGITIVDKSKAFVFEAGKIILAVAVVLWVLASFGPGDYIEKAHNHIKEESAGLSLSESELNDRVASYKLEHSYAGVIGKTLEPLISPLGYDWKIGIALVTSFAAREVFVGTMATIYSIGSTQDQTTIKSRMRSEINPVTGGPRYTPAVGFSLLVFYTFAMQCMSTLAVVYRETRGWKWPIIQLSYMTLLAYFSALIVFQALS